MINGNDDKVFNSAFKLMRKPKTNTPQNVRDKNRTVFASEGHIMEIYWGYLLNYYRKIKTKPYRIKKIGYNCVHYWRTMVTQK